mgnify:CR=1 FL=1
MFEFKRYCDIDNIGEGILAKIDYAIPSTMEWVAHEKIHGANFSIWIGKDEIRFASRQQWVDGTFYNCGPVMEALMPGFQSIQDSLKRTYSEPVAFIIYGELFGDKIQKGVVYPQGRHFRAFDIKIDGTYVNDSIFNYICEENCIPTVPRIKIGSLRELLELPLEFPTYLNPVEGNFAEGLVIKPIITTYFNNGSRVILKRKCARFSEKTSVKRAITAAANVSFHGTELLAELETYFTANRLDNVISKIGEIVDCEEASIEDFTKLTGLLIQDCLHEYEREHEICDLKAQFKDDWKALQPKLHRYAVPVVRQYFGIMS